MVCDVVYLYVSKEPAFVLFCFEEEAAGSSETSTCFHQDKRVISRRMIIFKLCVVRKEIVLFGPTFIIVCVLLIVIFDTVVNICRVKV